MGRKVHLSEMERYFNNMAQYKHKCKCGANVYLSKKYPKKLCSWCKTMNYLDPKEEFKEKLKNKLK